jgi:hypothetical protein
MGPCDDASPAHTHRETVISRAQVRWENEISLGARVRRRAAEFSNQFEGRQHIRDVPLATEWGSVDFQMPPRMTGVKRPRDISASDVDDHHHAMVSASHVIADGARMGNSGDLNRHLLEMMHYPPLSQRWVSARDAIHSMELVLGNAWTWILHGSTIDPDDQVSRYIIRTLVGLGLDDMLSYANVIQRSRVFQCLYRILSCDPLLAAAHAGPAAETLARGAGYAWPAADGVTPWKHFLAMVPDRHWSAILFNLLQTATDLAICSDAGKECYAMLMCMLMSSWTRLDVFERNALTRVRVMDKCPSRWCSVSDAVHPHVHRDGARQFPLCDILRQRSCLCPPGLSDAKATHDMRDNLIVAIKRTAARAAWRRALLCTLVLSRAVPVVALRIVIVLHMT